MTTRGAYREITSKAPTTLGGRLRCIRIAWGWSQADLAERLHTDQQIISLWERDKAQPSRAGLTLLANFLGLSHEALLSGVNFSIPDLPATEDTASSPLARALPQAEAGSLVAIPLATGEAQVLTLKEARALLGAILKSKGRAWIVVDGGLKPLVLGAHVAPSQQDG